MVLPVLGAIAGGIGTAIGGIASAKGASDANEMQIEAAKDQMRFQKKMSNTAYQRAMKDMRKAGLNPILAGRLGGASSPAGAQPNIQNEMAGMAQVGASISQQLNNSALTAAQVKQTEAQTRVINQTENRQSVLDPIYDLLGNIVRDFRPGMENTIRDIIDSVTELAEPYLENSADTAQKREERKREIQKKRDQQKFGNTDPKRWESQPSEGTDSKEYKRLKDALRRKQMEVYRDQWRKRHYGN